MSNTVSETANSGSKVSNANRVSTSGKNRGSKREWISQALRTLIRRPFQWEGKTGVPQFSLRQSLTCKAGLHSLCGGTHFILKRDDEEKKKPAQDQEWTITHTMHCGCDCHSNPVNILGEPLYGKAAKLETAAALT